MSKNGKNEGSIRKRSNGQWEARYTAGRNADGKQIQRSIYGKTRAEVAQKLNDTLAKLNGGDYIPPNKLTLSEWLKTWLKEYASVTVRPSTLISYEGYIYNHIDPLIGGIPLKDLTVDRIQAFYNEKAVTGRADGEDGGLSPKTMRNMHNMLHKALAQACTNNLIPRNVTEGAVLPKREKKEMRVLSQTEQRKLMAAAFCERLGFAVMLALGTGMRIGELCGLKWEDIDLEEKTIKVRRTVQRLPTSRLEKADGATDKTKVIEGAVKTDNAYREIPMHNALFKSLLFHKNEQEREKAALGPAYTDNGYVFATQLGGVIEPSTMRDMYKRLLAKAKIDHANFHALRHTFATRAIENGVPIKAVSDILGHATVQLTMDLYCHSSMELKRKAVDKMADMWR